MTGDRAQGSPGRPKPIALAELGNRDLARWRRLADRAAEPNPFFDPDFVIAAARGLGEYESVGVVRATDGDEWTACLPVRHYSRWRGIPLACTAAWKHTYSFLGTPLLAAGMETEAIPILLEAMLDSGRSAFALFEWLAADGPSAGALANGEAVPFGAFERATLDRRSEPDYLDHVKGKHRREFRRLAGRLEEECGGPLELIDHSGEMAAVEAFLELERSGWKGEAGTALASEPRHAEFFRTIARDFADRGALELLFLKAGEQTVAARCSLLAGGVNFCFKVAFDERYRRFSPGRELELRQIARFHAEPGQQRLDSCTAADNELYNRLWPDRRPIGNVAVCAAGPRGAAARLALRTAIGVRQRRRAGPSAAAPSAAVEQAGAAPS